MSKRRLSLILATLGFICLSSSACQAEEPTLTDEEQAIKQYNAGDYSGAVTNFRSCLSTTPNRPQIHYYLANCLLKLNQPEKAAQEYRITLSLTKDPKLTSYCRLGLDGCTSALTKSKEAEAVAGAIKRIDDQLLLEKSIRDSYVKSNVQSRLLESESNVRSLEAEKAEKIHSMETATWTDKHGSKQPLYSSDQIEATRRDFDQNINNAKDSATKATESLRENALRLGKALDEMATSLEDNLKTGANGNRQRMLPVGTNLYVHNYSLLDPHRQSKPADQELTATQELLMLDRHQRNRAFQTTVGPQSIPADSWRQSTTSVYGKLLQGN
jgi:tetratricopeptide (TPR) repeat protein